MNIRETIASIWTISAHAHDRTYRVTIAWSLGLALLEILSLGLLFMVVKALFDHAGHLVLPGGVQLELPLAMMVLAVLFTVKFLLSLAFQRYQVRTSLEMTANITRSLIRYYYGQPTVIFKQQPLADALNKVFTIGGYFSEMVFQSAVILVSEGFLTIVILVSLLVYNPFMVALLGLMMVPPAWFLLWKSRRRLKRISGQLEAGNVFYHQQVMTMLHGLFDIRASGNFSHFYAGFNEGLSKIQSNRRQILLEGGLPARLMEWFAIIGLCALFSLSMIQGSFASFSGTLAAFAVAAFRLLPSVSRMLGSLHNLELFREPIQFLKKIPLDRQPDPSDSDIPVEQVPSLHTIRLEGVSYAHTELAYVKGLDLEFKRGAMYAVSGPSGSGKSTLINLLTGLIHPDSGTLFYNDKPYGQNDAPVWFRRMSVVIQDPYILPGTVLDNVAFGLPVDENRIQQVLEKVKLGEWLKDQESGLQTLVGERGTLLSGGQKQRLALARALYREVEAIILDEPTTALDLPLRQEIVSLLSGLSRESGMMVIVVSHDPAVLEGSDHIIRMEKGHVVSE